ncbi:hypothetical protein J2T31_001601 [Kerstersia gyiorum]|uniref:hypothetical protein n=1 Tax=Kerstersia gyiorum TaxID=206506 RepID=UPI00209ED5B1|nr:hypothetical protein [Kerstersia gyiorum]MCP1678880.1 hypothetical protein [Kerstersia gyiorum]MCP1823383.1 hypothetical protein [Kerstersia gyiorum]MCP1826826.1 hypothetical protein [Kerstersia gyiorum]MCW2450625.1 hypothetical protein [Kerstersia gyiorum]
MRFVADAAWWLILSDLVQQGHSAHASDILQDSKGGKAVGACARAATECAIQRRPLSFLTAHGY